MPSPPSTTADYPLSGTVVLVDKLGDEPRGRGMAANIQEITARLGEVIGGSKVFGEPIERDGVTIVPVFRVSGGGAEVAAPTAVSVARVSVAASDSPADRWGCTYYAGVRPTGNRQ